MIKTAPLNTSGMRRGASLIELLVVLSLIGLLASLLGPAIQSARERARQTQCRNNLRQIGVAIHSLESQFGHVVSNGWNLHWIGEPSYGIGPGQPGGWIYNLLTFVDRHDLAALGMSSDATVRLEEQQRLMQTSVPVFRCPTRPAPSLSPPSPAPDRVLVNSVWPATVSKNDYAINGGESTELITDPSVTDSDGNEKVLGRAWSPSGVSGPRSQVRFAQVVDGLSNTLLVAEKYVPVSSYSSFSEGYDASMYNGACWDLQRWTRTLPRFDMESPIRGELLRTFESSFGSAHRDGVFHLLCDGSVRIVGYFVDTIMYRRLGNRHDGFPVTLD
jgi:prepilin-type N-terminal cleavage/methylation domain-containing protein